MRLVIETFSYRDHPRPALEGVELAVSSGECILVGGGSGSGKSTLGLVLAGVLPGQHRGDMTGRIDLDGQSVAFTGGQASRIDHQRWGGLVGYAGQDAAAQLSTIARTVADEIAFPLENAGMPRALMQERVRETARALGLLPLLDRDPSRLSGGQQKLVAIAAAIARNPGYLILDEPFAGLDLDARNKVRAAIGTLIEDGMAVILLSQDIAPTGLLPDRVVLLSAGRSVFDGPADDAAQTAVRLDLPVVGTAAAATGELFGKSVQAEPGFTAPPGSKPTANSGISVTAEGLGFSYGRRRPRGRRSVPPAAPVLDGVDMAVGPGECLAVTGANGSGKSTLLRLLTGLSVPQSGQVAFSAGVRGGERTRSIVPGALLQHPREQLFERTVRREVAAGLPRSLDEAARDARVDNALQRCGLMAAEGLHPYELPASGQRLAALAALLVRSPGFIALDEPTVSLDRPGLQSLAAAITAEAGRGAAIVMVTHDLDFARLTCSRLMVLSGGQKVADGPFDEVLEAHFGTGEAYGVAAPTTWHGWRAPGA